MVVHDENGDVIAAPTIRVSLGDQVLDVSPKAYRSVYRPAGFRTAEDEADDERVREQRRMALGASTGNAHPTGTSNEVAEVDPDTTPAPGTPDTLRREEVPPADPVEDTGPIAELELSARRALDGSVQEQPDAGVTSTPQTVIPSSGESSLAPRRGGVRSITRESVEGRTG